MSNAPDEIGADKRNWKDTAKDFVFAKDDDSLAPMCVVHVCIVCYAFSFWFCQPVEPYLLKKLGGDKMTYGYVVSLVNFCMLLGGPLIGRICDTMGVVVGTVIALSGVALSYFLMAIAWDVPSFFFSRLPTVFMAVMQVSQTIVSHHSTKVCRSEALGRLSVSYALGMLLGALSGGFFGEHFGYQANSAVACIVMLLLVPLFMAFVPSQHLDKAEGDESGNLRFGVFFEMFSRPRIFSLVCTSLLVAIGVGLFRFTFPNAMLYYYKLDPSDQGVIIAFGAGVSIISNVFLVGPAVRWSGDERRATLLMLAIGMVSVIAFAYTGPANVWLVYVLLVPKAAAGAIVMTILTSLFSKATPLEQVGTSVAIQHAISSATGIFLPMVGNWMFSAHGFAAVCLSSAAVLCFAFAHGTVAVGLRIGEAVDGEATLLSPSISA